MKESILIHKLNSFELQILGFLTSLINDISKRSFELCPIYDSLHDLSIRSKKTDKDRIVDEIGENKVYSIIDPLGFFTQDDSRKLITIFINVGKINTKSSNPKNRRLITIVLLHEIGHYIAYNTPLFGEIKVPNLNKDEYRSDTDFQELWAQAFTYKLLSDFADTSVSDKSAREAKKLMTEMDRLADGQAQKYRTFRDLFGESINSFSGKSYRKIKIRDLFTMLFFTRNNDLKYGYYSENFKNLATVEFGEIPRQDLKEYIRNFIVHRVGTNPNSL